MLCYDLKLKIFKLQDNLVTVGSVDCAKHRDLCERIGYHNELLFFKANDIQPGKGMVSP